MTTTSYTILGLLAIRPWSTYELTKQIRRGFQHFWPRAESNVYAEAKRLVDAGLATTEEDEVGKRPRRVYSITPAGHDALVRWLGTASAPSRLESEILVKVSFGNLGTKEELLANLRRFGDEAAAARQFWQASADEYVRGTHPYPERMHINALLFRWLWGQADANARWAEWAMDWVGTWPDTATPADVEGALEVFRGILRASYDS